MSSDMGPCETQSLHRDYPCAKTTGIQTNLILSLNRSKEASSCCISTNYARTTQESRKSASKKCHFGNRVPPLLLWGQLRPLAQPIPHRIPAILLFPSLLFKSFLIFSFIPSFHPVVLLFHLFSFFFSFFRPYWVPLIDWQGICSCLL